MDLETIEFSVSNGVARLTLNRPDKLNSFNAQMHHDVRSCLATIQTDETTRCLLITGNGRGFCAGQDLSDRSVAPDAEVPDLGKSLEESYNPLVRSLMGLDIPVVCAVNGVAAGRVDQGRC